MRNITILLYKQSVSITLKQHSATIKRTNLNTKLSLAQNNLSPMDDHRKRIFPEYPGLFKRLTRSNSTSQTSTVGSQSAALASTSPLGPHARLIIDLCSIL